MDIYVQIITTWILLEDATKCRTLSIESLKNCTSKHLQQGCVGAVEVLCPLSLSGKAVLGGHSDSLFLLAVGSCCEVGVSEGQTSPAAV